MDDRLPDELPEALRAILRYHSEAIARARTRRRNRLQALGVICGTVWVMTILARASEEDLDDRYGLRKDPLPRPARGEDGPGQDPGHGQPAPAEV